MSRFQWARAPPSTAQSNITGVLDNMLVAHGRAPFEGERKILAGMSQPMSWDQLGV